MALLLDPARISRGDNFGSAPTITILQLIVEDRNDNFVEKVTEVVNNFLDVLSTVIFDHTTLLLELFRRLMKLIACPAYRQKRSLYNKSDLLIHSPNLTYLKPKRPLRGILGSDTSR